MLASFHITTDPSLDPNRQYKIDHAGKIDKQSFKILVGFFTALSTLAAVMRIVFRLSTRHKLYLDDWLVIFATSCFLSATGVIFSYYNKMYIVETLMRGIDVSFTVVELLSLTDIMKWNNIFLCLAWTANFAIKFSFLAFFHTLIRDVSVKLNRYYWFIVGYTGLSWVFVIVEPFILCPNFNSISAMRSCPDHKLNVILVTFLFVFDITTDIMIASIPMILLRMSHLHVIQKIRIATFLCLSLVIVVVSLVRLVGGLHHSTRGKYEFSMQWTFTILHIEAAIAVLMGAISALRTVFAKQSPSNDTSASPDKSPVVFIYQKFLRLVDTWRDSAEDDKVKEHGSPRLDGGIRTQPTLKGLRTWIRRHERSQGHTTLASTSSEMEDYHEFKRKEKREGVKRDVEAGRGFVGAGECPATTGNGMADDHEPWITKPESLAGAV